MAWNGTGTYTLPPAYSPEVNGTTIDAARYNGLTSDVATGITAALAKNGENVPTANLPMGGFKHTGAGDANATGQYVAFNQATAVGSLTITTFTAGNINLTSSTIPANGMYLKAANNPALSSNTTLRWDVNSTGQHAFAAPTAGTAMTVTAVAGANTANFIGTTGTLINTNLLLQHDGTNAFFRTQNAGSLNLGANGNNNVTIASAGNVTVVAPTSGDTLTVGQVSGGLAVRTNVSINGGDVLWGIQNSSNTASSRAGLAISVAGASAEDAFVKLSVTGVTDWYAGIDNSDSDKFKISGTAGLGSADYLVVTTDGRVYGTALHNNAGAVTGTTNQYIASGSYQPAPTITTNLTTVTATSATCGKWTRVGNVVQAACQFDVDPTAGGLCDFHFSLPIASTLTATGLSGTAVGNSTAPLCGVILADTGNNHARVQFIAGADLASRTWYLTFSYEVN